jgi:hypothetical protein
VFFVRTFSTEAISPPSHELCQNGGHSVLFSIGETEKYGGWETTVMLLFVKNSLGQKGSVRRTVVLIQQTVFIAEVQDEVFAFSRSRRKTSQ